MSWLGSNWIWLLVLGLLAWLLMSRRSHPRLEGYGNCGSYAGSDDEETELPRPKMERRPHGYR